MMDPAIADVQLLRLIETQRLQAMIAGTLSRTSRFTPLASSSWIPLAARRLVRST